MEPPSCEVDAGCQASCDADASIQAECTPGRVSVTGDMSVKLKGALEAQLPQIELIGKRAEITVDAAASLFATLRGFEDADGVEIACAVFVGGQELVDSAQTTASSVQATLDGVATLSAALPQ